MQIKKYLNFIRIAFAAALAIVCMLFTKTVSVYAYTATSDKFTNIKGTYAMMTDGFNYKDLGNTAYETEIEWNTVNGGNLETKVITGSNGKCYVIVGRVVKKATNDTRYVTIGMEITRLRNPEDPGDKNPSIYENMNYKGLSYRESVFLRGYPYGTYRDDVRDDYDLEKNRLHTLFGKFKNDVSSSMEKLEYYDFDAELTDVKENGENVYLVSYQIIPLDTILVAMKRDDIQRKHTITSAVTGETKTLETRWHLEYEEYVNQGLDYYVGIDPVITITSGKSGLYNGVTIEGRYNYAGAVTNTAYKQVNYSNKVMFFSNDDIVGNISAYNKGSTFGQGYATEFSSQTKNSIANAWGMVVNLNPHDDVKVVYYDKDTLKAVAVDTTVTCHITTGTSSNSYFLYLDKDMVIDGTMGDAVGKKYQLQEFDTRSVDSGAYDAYGKLTRLALDNTAYSFISKGSRSTNYDRTGAYHNLCMIFYCTLQNGKYKVMENNGQQIHSMVPKPSEDLPYKVFFVPVEQINAYDLTVRYVLVENGKVTKEFTQVQERTSFTYESRAQFVSPDDSSYDITTDGHNFKIGTKEYVVDFASGFNKIFYDSRLGTSIITETYSDIIKKYNAGTYANVKMSRTEDTSSITYRSYYTIKGNACLVIPLKEKQSYTMNVKYVDASSGAVVQTVSSDVTVSGEKAEYKSATSIVVNGLEYEVATESADYKTYKPMVFVGRDDTKTVQSLEYDKLKADPTNYKQVTPTVSKSTKITYSATGIDGFATLYIPVKVKATNIINIYYIDVDDGGKVVGQTATTYGLDGSLSQTIKRSQSFGGVSYAVVAEKEWYTPYDPLLIISSSGSSALATIKNYDDGKKQGTKKTFATDEITGSSTSTNMVYTKPAGTIEGTAALFVPVEPIKIKVRFFNDETRGTIKSDDTYSYTYKGLASYTADSVFTKDGVKYVVLAADEATYAPMFVISRDSDVRSKGYATAKSFGTVITPTKYEVTDTTVTATAKKGSLHAYAVLFIPCKKLETPITTKYVDIETDTIVKEEDGFYEEDGSVKVETDKKITVGSNTYEVLITDYGTHVPGFYCSTDDDILDAGYDKIINDYPPRINPLIEEGSKYSFSTTGLHDNAVLIIPVKKKATSGTPLRIEYIDVDTANGEVVKFIDTTYNADSSADVTVPKTFTFAGESYHILFSDYGTFQPIWSHNETDGFYGKAYKDITNGTYPWDTPEIAVEDGANGRYTERDGFLKDFGLLLVPVQKDPAATPVPTMSVTTTDITIIKNYPDAETNVTTTESACPYAAPEVRTYNTSSNYFLGTAIPTTEHFTNNTEADTWYGSVGMNKTEVDLQLQVNLKATGTYDTYSLTYSTVTRYDMWTVWYPTSYGYSDYATLISSGFTEGVSNSGTTKSGDITIVQSPGSQYDFSTGKSVSGTYYWIYQAGPTTYTDYSDPHYDYPYTRTIATGVNTTTNGGTVTGTDTKIFDYHKSLYGPYLFYSVADINLHELVDLTVNNNCFDSDKYYASAITIPYAFKLNQYTGNGVNKTASASTGSKLSIPALDQMQLLKSHVEKSSYFTTDEVFSTKSKTEVVPAGYNGWITHTTTPQYTLTTQYDIDAKGNSHAYSYYVETTPISTIRENAQKAADKAVADYYKNVYTDDLSKRLTMHSDVVSLNGKTYSEEYNGYSGADIQYIGTESNDKFIGTAQDVQIPEATLNGLYSTKLTANYKAIASTTTSNVTIIKNDRGHDNMDETGDEKKDAIKPIYKLNEPIAVHSPVVSPLKVIGEGKTQSANVDDTMEQLFPDETYTFTFTWDNMFFANYSLGYNETDIWNSYTRKKEVRFPFPVYFKGTYYPLTVTEPSESGAHTVQYTEWIELEQSQGEWDAFDIYIPSWVKNEVYDSSHTYAGRTDWTEASIQTRVWANNSTDSMSAYFNEYNATRDYYIAKFNLPVQITSIVYGFEVDSVNDQTSYGSDTTELDGWTNLARIKNERKVGTYNRFGRNYLRYTYGQDVTSLWNQKYTLPFTTGKAEVALMGTWALGQEFSYTFKTISAEIDGVDDWAEIIPTYRYVAPDGTVYDSDKIRVYYDSDADRFIEIGSSRDTVQTANLKSTLADTEYYGTLCTQPYNDTCHFDIGCGKYYNFLKLTADIFGISVTDLKSSLSTFGNLGLLKLDKATMLFSGDEAELKANQTLNASSITRYSTASIGSDYEAFEKSMQTWYGKYRIPSNLYVARRYDDAGVEFSLYDEPGVTGWFSTHGAMSSDDMKDLFMSDGYLILNFEIRIYVDGELSFTYFSNDLDMWSRENGNTRSYMAYDDSYYVDASGNVVPATGAVNISAKSGDIAVISLRKKHGTPGGNEKDPGMLWIQ